MASELVPQPSKHPRRVMIITDDEAVIEQIQSNNNLSVDNSVVINPAEDHDDISNLPNTKHVTHQKRGKVGSLICVVCGSLALGYNFDAITCESCKAFFRRNALKDPAKLHCRRNSTCEVTSETRRRCSACRLIKCLNCGMKRERLQRAEEKAARRRSLQPHRHPISNNQSTVDEKNIQTSASDKGNAVSLLDIHHLELQSQQELLSSADLDRVEKIGNLYEQRIELAALDGLPWDPSKSSTTFLQHVNSRSVPAIRLLAFFRRIPEFHQLNVDDKVTLIKYNLMPLSILNASLSYRKEVDQVIESDNDIPWDSYFIQKTYGDDVFTQVKQIFRSFVSIGQQDRRIIQLTLIILILTKGFSTDPNGDEPNLNDGTAVYHAQNFFTELLWKYMESTHGFEKSTQIFMRLVVNFISWQTIEKHVRISIRRILSSTDTNQLLPIMKSLLNMS